MNRHILNLDNCTKIIVLHKGAIIIARIKGKTYGTHLKLCINRNLIVHVEIKFTIGIHRKGNSAFHKNKSVIKVVHGEFGGAGHSNTKMSNRQ